MSLKPTSIPTKRLNGSINATEMSFALDDIIGWDGLPLTSADFGTQHYCVFRNGNRSAIEIMEIDPSTIANNVITIVRRGLDFDGDRLTEVSINKLSWTSGDTYVDLGTDTPQLWQYLKEYIDGISIAGAPDASETAKGLVEEATQAQTIAGTDTGETGARLFVPPSKLPAVIRNVDSSLIAGATINGATLPVPVYQKVSDGELYACDANDTAALAYIGFAISNSTDGNAISFQSTGIVTGFSGLTPGERYYVQDAVGTIGTTPGTREILVGKALSATKLLIMHGKHRINGSLSFSDAGSSGAVQDTVITAGFRLSSIQMFMGKLETASTPDQPYFAFGTFVNSTLAGATSDNTTFTLGSDWQATIVNITSTTFTIRVTQTVSGPTSMVFTYMAEGDI